MCHGGAPVRGRRARTTDGAHDSSCRASSVRASAENPVDVPEESFVWHGARVMSNVFAISRLTCVGVLVLPSELEMNPVVFSLWSSVMSRSCVNTPLLQPLSVSRRRKAWLARHVDDRVRLWVTLNKHNGKLAPAPVETGNSPSSGTSLAGSPSPTGRNWSKLLEFDPTSGGPGGTRIGKTSASRCARLLLCTINARASADSRVRAAAAAEAAATFAGLLRSQARRSPALSWRSRHSLWARSAEEQAVEIGRSGHACFRWSACGVGSAEHGARSPVICGTRGVPRAEQLLRKMPQHKECSLKAEGRSRCAGFAAPLLPSRAA